MLPAPRADIDYGFTPHGSKKDILGRVKEVLSEIEGAENPVDLHSRTIRATVRLGKAGIQVGASVGVECESRVVPTGGFSRSLGRPFRLVRVMELGLALSHQLAAWNERLGRVRPRLPAMKGRRSMTRVDFAADLRRAVDAISDEGI